MLRTMLFKEYSKFFMRLGVHEVLGKAKDYLFFDYLYFWNGLSNNLLIIPEERGGGLNNVITTLF